MGVDWAQGVHSEPHILEYLEAVNSQRPENQRLQMTSFYTEREPCGPILGTDCSSFLQSHLPSDVPIHYGTAFRKGQVENEAELRAAGQGAGVNSYKNDAVSAQGMDSQDYVNKLHDIWLELGVGGHLS